MGDMFTVDASELVELGEHFQTLEGAVRKIILLNIRDVTEKAKDLSRVELEDVRYTGALEKSLTVTVSESNLMGAAYPTAAHRMYVRTGTKPHWAPIGPLKRWAAAKLGDERLGYAVQRSIAKYGTSNWQRYTRGTKANPWPIRVINRSDFQQALRMAAEKTGGQIAAEIVE